MRACPFCGEHVADRDATCCCCRADLINNVPVPPPLISMCVVSAPIASDSRKEFYVYFHRDRDGRIFYVGKGTGRRAWSPDRDVNWRTYVSRSSGGHYDVEIFRDGLSDADACELESFLIGAHGHHLVNWINTGRPMDYAALEKYHELRNANRAFVAETRAYEKTDPELAIVRYRQAIEAMHTYATMKFERGLIAELQTERNYADVGILDRLTMLLVRCGRGREATDAAQDFFARYPEPTKF
jgi:hypothetical protein